MSKKINIRPQTSVYATYKNINYDPWTAIAEFVDNSTQSFYSNKSKLKKIDCWNGLDVEIIYEHNKGINERIIVRDNAFGMDFDDFQRAIILDSPPKRATRSEFGMGLKTAACWFGKKWSVESTALGSNVKYYAEVDVEQLKKSKDEEIVVDEIQCDKEEHGTIITIWDLNRRISGRQIGKTKNQLAGMYRVDLRRGDINIYYNGEPLSYKEPQIIIEELPDGSKTKWKKKIKFSIDHEGKEYKVKGFVALREEGSTSSAGFTLIRRGRVIVGGYENTYRPEEIFEKSNSYVYQRLFGEIELNNWPVTQTKDAFDWYGGLEDLLIDKLREECEDYILKAKTYRKKRTIKVDPSIDRVVDRFEKAGIITDAKKTAIRRDVTREIDNDTDNNPNIPDHKPDESNIRIDGPNGRRIIYKLGNRRYVVNFVLKSDNYAANWLNIRRSEIQENEYIIEWNIRHPFFKPYVDEPDFLEFLQTFTFAFAVSEIETMNTSVDGKITPGAIRMKMNENLKAIVTER